MTRQNDEIVLDLRQICLALRRYILPALLAMVLLGGTGFAFGTLRRYTRYTAGVDYFIYADKAGTTLYAGTQEEARSAVQAGTTAFEMRARAYADVLTGPAMAGAVIEKLGLDMEPEDLMDMLSMEVPEDFQVMRILTEGKNKDLVLSVAETVADLAPDMIRTRVGSGSVRAAEGARISSETVGGRKRYLFAGMAAGLLLVLGFGCIRELLYPGFRTEEEIQRTLGLPVLGAVPAGRAGREDALRYLRLSIQQLFREKRKPLRRRRGRVLALVAADREANASALAGALQESLSRAGQMAALVMEGEEDPERGIYSPPGEEASAFYSDLKDRYAWILTVSRPLSEAPWGIEILDQADRSVFVLAYDRTGRLWARQALDLMEGREPAPSGLILTGFDTDKAKGDSLARFLPQEEEEKEKPLLQGLLKRGGRGEKDGK